MSAVEQLTAERDAAKSALERERVGHCFTGSRYIAEKLAVPAAMVQATFGNHFVLENGRAVARDAHGNTIMSRARLGEPADFDEALELLVDGCGYGDRIKKGSGASGSGAAAESWRPSRPAPMKRAAFFGSLSPADQAAFMRAGGTLTD
jgi:hypothetical protein